MIATVMRLRIFLPYQVFEDRQDVVCIVAESTEGSFGLLPNRLDCAATIVPGILSCETLAGCQAYFAVDEGVLVKTGPEVRLSVRQAFSGTDLRLLRDTVEREFLAHDAQERGVRQVLAKLEIGLLRRFGELQHG